MSSKVDTQVSKLLQEGIIEENDSAQSSPIIVKVGVDAQQIWRLRDFRRLNERQ
jgi:hypothetical protein